jgi:hypothetical protein
MQAAETILEKSESAIFGRVFANGRQTLSPELARHVLALTFGEQDKERMHELAVGNQEGALSAEDKEELHNYIKVGHLLAVLQSQARQALKK